MLKVYSTLTFLFFVFSLQAQYQIGLVPRVSPDKAVYQKIGFNEVEIRYGIPRVKGRTIWGGLEEYDIVWRAGANNATTVSFTQDVMIHGMELKADTYALFIVPQMDSAWTVIFSKKHKQWGAFRYDPKDDALQLNVMPQLVNFREELQYSIHSDSLGKGKIRFQWEKVQLDIDFTFDYIQSFIDKINSKETTPDTKWVVFLQGAEFLLEEKKELDIAYSWLEQSEKLFQEDGAHWIKGEHYYLGHIYWVKAQVLAELGNFSEAIKLTEKLMAFEHPKSFYHKKNESKGIDMFLDSLQNSKKK